VKLSQRVRRRSGELCFDPRVDLAAEQPEPRLRWINELALPASSVVDFGCWTGGALSIVAASAGRAVGVDIPGPWIDEARRRLPSAEIITVPSFTDLPRELSDQFELALFLETLEHIPRRLEPLALRSIYQSLRPGGTLVLSTPLAGLGAVLDPAWVVVGHRHYRRSTLRRLLEGVGFSSVQIRYSGNLHTSVDIFGMYGKKYLLGRPLTSSAAMRARIDTGLFDRRSLATPTVWALARRPLADEGGGPPL